MTARQWEKLATEYLLPHLPDMRISGRWLLFAPIGWQVRGFMMEPSQSDKQRFTLETCVVPLFTPQPVGLTFSTRLGWLARKKEDKWWNLDQTDVEEVFVDIRQRILHDGVPYLAKRTTVEAMSGIRRHQVVQLSDERYIHQAMLCANILLGNASMVEREWKHLLANQQRISGAELREWEVQFHEATEHIYRLYHEDPVAACKEIIRWRYMRAEELRLTHELMENPEDLRDAARSHFRWLKKR